MFFIGGTRLVYREIYNFFNLRERKPTIIFGVDDSTRQIIRSLNVNSDYRPICFIETDKNLIGNIIDGLQVYSYQEIKKIVNKFNIKLILISSSETSNKIKDELLRYLSEDFIEIKIIPNFKDLINKNLSIREFKNISYEQLMKRSKAKPLDKLMKKNNQNKNILITGARRINWYRTM